ncbi:hypothetical protein EVU96_08925 [Bacillus infantis]|uniref:hypothetical protein n=1 Tax=Bacillus infantis TaxID=324767 RepID=UPI00101DA3F4|nr:hypothetical protein [Bacillus infantis]RYI30527.1 hypothetical protein EVU96_08925 [Bacillus infantis]
MEFKELLSFIETNKKVYLERELGANKTKVYVLKFGENEYAESFDLGLREVTVIDDKFNAEHIHSQLQASYYAERFGCGYEEIEIED